MNASAAERYFCHTLVAVNTRPYPFFATLRLDHLDLPAAVLPRAGTTKELPVTRLFRGSRNAKVKATTAVV